MRRHDPCNFCGGPVRWKKTAVDLRRGAKRLIFDNVSFWACLWCGEHYYPGPLLQRLEKILLEGRVNGTAIRARVVVPRVDCARLSI